LELDRLLLLVLVSELVLPLAIPALPLLFFSAY
jgi:hypothetical protein